MDFREIIVWLGLLAILVILWDGFRRMKANPKTKKPKKDKWVDPEVAAKKAEIARELPNGARARVREMTHDEQEKLNSKIKLNLRERVPMLMERVVVEGKDTDAERLANDADTHDELNEDGEQIIQPEFDFTLVDTGIDVSEPTTDEVTPKQHHIEPTMSSFDDDVFDANLDEGLADEEYSDEELTDDEVSELERSMPFEPDAFEDDESESDWPVNEEPVNTDINSDEINDFGEGETASEALVSEVKTEEAEPSLPVEDLIVVHLMAKNKGEINGRGLLELLIRAGLRHGPMDIFHYRNPAGKTEFSLANCVQPGTFNPDAMADVNTPGVTLFLQLPCTADAMESFEHMIEMARFMAANLDTDMLDEDHNSMTPQVIEYYREKLRAFARKKLIPS